MSFFKKSKLDEYRALEQKIEKKYTVLLVDDEPANLKVMTAILSPHYEIITASDGLDALHVIEQLDNYDKLACIISDQRMPNMTGVQLFTKIRDLIPDTLRTIVTGYIDLDAIVDSVNNASIYKFIIKPFDFNDFLLSTHAAVELFDMKIKVKNYQKDLESEVESRTVELAQVNQLLVKGLAELERIYADVLNLNQLSNLLPACETINQVLDTVVKLIPQILPPSKGAVCLLDDKQLVSRLVCWQGGISLANSKIDVAGLTEKGFDLFSLQHQTTMLGYLIIDYNNHEAADNRLQKPLAEAISKQLSLSLSNVMLRESLVQQSIIDPLTAVYNRRYMNDTLRRELARAERGSSSIALIMIDVDHFKPLNDNHGHDFGDLVLTSLAKTLKNNSRQGDTLCRFGGEEFIFILPNTAAEPAAKKAEELRLLVNQLSFANSQNEMLAITISLGVACYPQHGMDSETLLKTADTALYQAKAKGRNCVVLA